MMGHWVSQRYDGQPHRVEKFKICSEPKFQEKVRDVVGLYLNPPDRPLVLFLDEKSHIQVLDRTAPILPLWPGLMERQTYDYKQHGTTTLFAAFNILNGKVIGHCLLRHRGREFVRFLHELEKEASPDLDICLIVDNYSTHNSVVVQRWLRHKTRRGFHLHFTRGRNSRPDRVERWFAVITQGMIRRRTFASVAEPERATYQWLANWNSQPQPFIRKVAAVFILDKAHLCKQLAERGTLA